MIRYLSMVLFVAVSAIVFLDAPADAQKTMSVQVREGHLRATPSHLGKIVTSVSYGDQVAVLENAGVWDKVSVAGGKVQGWIHHTALTSQKIALKSGKTGVSASVSQSEIALAGKGFSKEIEASYSKANKNLNYAWINTMETYKVSPSQMQRFIADGRLVPHAEGGKP